MRDPIGVVGTGVVGSCVVRYFRSEFQTEVIPYDKYKLHGTLESLDENCGTIFICVPTPTSEGQVDLSAIEETLEGLTQPHTIVLKSTVTPGTSKLLSSKFPIHQILFNPEFLVEKSAYEDFIHPHLQLVGVAKVEDWESAKKLLELLPFAKVKLVLSAREAEMVKLALNSYLAMKVIFANQLYDLSQELGVYWSTIAELIQADPRVGIGHLNVNQDNYRGFGGKCLPKDLEMVLGLAKSLGIPQPLLEAVDSINKDLRQE